MKKIIPLLILASLTFSCKEKQEIENVTNHIGLSKDINFIHLNPKRGDKAPQAGAIYGNIRKNVPTGYIGKFKDGFSSPPHIQKVTGFL